MLALDKSLCSIETSESDVLDLFESLPVPINLTGSRSEPRTAFICAVKKKSGVQVYVALTAEHGRNFFYTGSKSGGGANNENYRDELEEALGFARSMGFAPERVNLEYSAAMRAVVVKNYKIFNFSGKPPKAPANAPNLSYEKPPLTDEFPDALPIPGAPVASAALAGAASAAAATADVIVKFGKEMSALRAERDELSVQVQEFSAAQLGVTAELKLAKAENRKLVAERDKLAASAAAFETSSSDLAAAREQAAQAQKELADALEAADQANREAARLGEETAAARQEAAMLREQAAAAQKKAVAAGKEAAAAQKETATAREEAAAAREAVISAELEAAAAREEAVAAQQEAAVAREEAAAARKEADGAKEESATAQESAARVQEALAGAEREAAVAKKETADANRKLAGAKEKAAKSAADAARARDELAGAAREAARVDKDGAQEKTGAGNEIETLQAKVDAIGTERDEALDRAEMLERQLEAKTAEMDALRSELAVLRTEHEDPAALDAAQAPVLEPLADVLTAPAEMEDVNSEMSLDLRADPAMEQELLSPDENDAVFAEPAAAMEVAEAAAEAANEPPFGSAETVTFPEFNNLGEVAGRAFEAIPTLMERPAQETAQVTTAANVAAELTTVPALSSDPFAGFGPAGDDDFFGGFADDAEAAFSC